MATVDVKQTNYGPQQINYRSVDIPFQPAANHSDATLQTRHPDSPATSHCRPSPTVLRPGEGGSSGAVARKRRVQNGPSQGCKSADGYGTPAASSSRCSGTPRLGEAVMELTEGYGTVRRQQGLRPIFQSLHATLAASETLVDVTHNGSSTVFQSLQATSAGSEIRAGVSTGDASSSVETGVSTSDDSSLKLLLPRQLPLQSPHGHQLPRQLPPLSPEGQQQGLRVLSPHGQHFDLSREEESLDHTLSREEHALSHTATATSSSANTSMATMSTSTPRLAKSSTVTPTNTTATPEGHFARTHRGKFRF